MPCFIISLQARFRKSFTANLAEADECRKGTSKMLCFSMMRLSLMVYYRCDLGAFSVAISFMAWSIHDTRSSQRLI
jgi:hypothetical protein